MRGAFLAKASRCVVLAALEEEHHTYFVMKRKISEGKLSDGNTQYTMARSQEAPFLFCDRTHVVAFLYSTGR